MLCFTSNNSWSIRRQTKSLSTVMANNEMSSIKRLLVLGQSGLLAQSVSKVARKQGYDVFTLSREQGADLSTLKAGDFLSEALERMRPTLIINATGITDLNYCEVNPERAWMLHARLPALIAELANKTQCPWVHVSTDHYFNGQENVLHSELDTPKPPNTYAASKLAGEALALTSPTALVIRTNIIGRRGWPNQPNFAEWVMECLIKQKPFDAYTDTWASSIEVTQFSELALVLAENGQAGLLNVGCSDAISKAELIEKIAHRAGYATHFMNKVPTPNSGQVRRANAMGLDCSKARKRLSDLEESLPSVDEVVEALVKSFSEQK